jgi:wobble nucleotide-excising tRNase
MIEGFDIQNFGSFKNFQWNSVRDKPGNNVIFFKKLNLLYGRNCSGKTTLSRILRCLEIGELPQNYELPVFSVQTSAGTFTQADIPNTPHSVRVYNRDFVEKHLGFLRHQDGTIEPFATFGPKNKEIEAKISSRMQQLGSAEDKTGLLYEQAQAIAASEQARQAAIAAEQALDATLTRKATNPPDGMKHKPKFGDINYNKTKLRADIQTAKSNGVQPLSDDAARDFEALVGESAIPPVSKRLEFTANLPSITAAVKELLMRRIQPTQPIQELLNDAVLQAWVKDGMQHHRNKRTTCGYCRQPLPSDLWMQLDAHFNKKSVELDSAIADQLRGLRQEEDALALIGGVDSTAIYTVFRPFLANLKNELDSEIARYKGSLETLAHSLRRREANIFEPQPIPMVEDNSQMIADKIFAINNLIVDSNDKTNSLEADKTKATHSLRLSEAAKFSVDIDFDSIESTNADLRREAERLASLVVETSNRVRQIEREIRELRDQQRDEKRAAARINDFLNKHFGHQGLRLEAVEDKQTAQFKFRIVRGTALAHNLSEGECSLVAFCYFLAKLEDTDAYGKNLIVWIDDPISSLDNNHIFFVFSLIESQLTRPLKDSDGNDIYRYEQLFISTHNLEFLKYLGRLTGPPNKSTRHYLVVQKDASSVVECMPSHLKQYYTEFNFLFGEIHTCTEPANNATHHHCFYSFGNNLRRFLEAYLFFKYPFTEGGADKHYDQRISRFFGGDIGTETLIQRLTNEYSHLGQMFDRSMQPVDCDEIAKVARFVLNTIRDSDFEQYTCLLESIGKTDPF